MVVDANEEHVKRKKDGCKRWLGRQLKEGARGAHAWVKREATEPETLVMIDGTRTAAPHDIVEMDFQSWSAKWGKLAARGGAPWRQEEAGADTSAALPAITG